jgi:hypothetical protein
VWELKLQFNMLGALTADEKAALIQSSEPKTYDQMNPY